MPLDDAIDWEVMGPKYRTRMIQYEAALMQIVELETLEDGKLSTSGEIANAALDQ